MRGVFPILVTPFDEQELIDEDSLRREVDFVIGAGVHGIGLALGSEILKLTEAEREQLAIGSASGRVFRGRRASPATRAGVRLRIPCLTR